MKDSGGTRRECSKGAVSNIPEREMRGKVEDLTTLIIAKQLEGGGALFLDGRDIVVYARKILEEIYG